MSHLDPEELLDIAEGASSHAPHLDSCESCRQRLAELRVIMRTVASVEMPEPSPLFWDHFSARVRVAVAAEEPPGRTFLSVWSSRAVGPLVLAAAAALLVVAVMSSRGARSLPVSVASLPVTGVTQAVTGAAPEALIDSAVDPSFTFVADLTANMDIDTALAAGLVSDSTAEHAVAHLSQGELRELARLLKEEIARAQAS
jgi:hypothetical protein